MQKHGKSHVLQGSITVMMSLVLLIITSLMLVTLEHAYLQAGKTLLYQTVNKGMESALGRFYAPLYTQYGLFAIPIGTGLSYNDYIELEEAVIDTVNNVFSMQTDGDAEPFIWNAQATDASCEDKIFLTDESGAFFKAQAVSAAEYELVSEISETLLSLKGLDAGGISELLSGAKNQVSGAEEEIGRNDSESGGGSGADGDEDEGARQVYNTLTAFLQDGFSGWWFENAGSLSEKKIDRFELPGYQYIGDTGTTQLFEEPDFGEMVFDNGEYLDEFVSESLAGGFEDAIKEAAEGSSTKALLAGYAFVNMDSYLKNDVDGKLKYEQEYLIFGNALDESNVKKAGWSIFGIRLIANLLFILTDTSAMNEIKEWLAEITVIASWLTVLLVLAAVVLAVENAIVETAAILKGKSVDFAVTKESQTVRLDEIFSFSKAMVMAKASAYKGAGGLKISYAAYLYLFMLMVREDVLTGRLMDIVELNMQKIYNGNFRLDKCLIGFGLQAKCEIQPLFTASDLFIGKKGGSGANYIVQTAIMYP